MQTHIYYLSKQLISIVSKHIFVVCIEDGINVYINEIAGT